MNPKDKHADWLLKPTANELTDEEILFIADEVDIPDAPDTKDLIEFARAILRKAQEK